MVNRLGNESQEHANLVQMMANYYPKQGYKTVKADLNGYEKPNQIIEHQPDVTAEGKAPFVIFEAETCNTIDLEHTESQWKEFSNYAKQNGGVFHIAVPRACYDKAVARVKQLGLIAEVWQPS